MDDNGQQLTTLDKIRQQWTTIDSNGQQWITMENNWQQLISMDNNWYQWTTMDNDGQQLTTMGNNGQQRTTTDNNGLDLRWNTKKPVIPRLVSQATLWIFDQNLSGSVPLAFKSHFEELNGVQHCNKWFPLSDNVLMFPEHKYEKFELRNIKLQHRWEYIDTPEIQIQIHTERQ